MLPAGVQLMLNNPILGSFVAGATALAIGWFLVRKAAQYQRELEEIRRRGRVDEFGDAGGYPVIPNN